VHGWYCKYYNGERISILRLRCAHCRRTHAVMPSFSVPNSSHATACIDAYLRARSSGRTRRQAAQGLSLESFSYPTLKRLDQRAELRSMQLKAIDPHHGSELLSGYQSLQARAESESPVAVLNWHYLIGHGRGWLFGNISALTRHPYPGTVVSRDLPNTQHSGNPIDSS
jgi:hypothetical protein